MFKVEIKNLKVKTRIGIKPNERNKPQLLLVTLSFNYSLSKKLNANNIKNLKDYSAITRYLKNFIKNNSYNTLEKLILECTKSLKNYPSTGRYINETESILDKGEDFIVL